LNTAQSDSRSIVVEAAANACGPENDAGASGEGGTNVTDALVIG